ncbi:MAG: general negative regulator of transcription subunit 5 [Chaenotheca gracillima]|nr:MAG: general negative regulator of transcription subunit 5 [Chaenotheca gracillima]
MTTQHDYLLHQLHHADRQYSTRILEDLPIPQSAVSDALMYGRRRKYPLQPRVLPPTPPPTPTRPYANFLPVTVPFLSSISSNEEPTSPDHVYLPAEARPGRPSGCPRTASASASIPMSRPAPKLGRRQPSDTLVTVRHRETARGSYRQGGPSPPVMYARARAQTYQPSTTTIDLSLGDWAASTSLSSTSTSTSTSASTSTSTSTSTSPPSRSSIWSVNSPYEWGTGSGSAQSAFSDDDSDSDSDSDKGNGAIFMSSISKLCMGEKRRRLKRKIVRAMKEPWSPGKVGRE